MKNAKEAIEDLVKFNTEFPVVAELCEVTRVNGRNLTCEARSLKNDNYYSAVRLAAVAGTEVYEDGEKVSGDPGVSQGFIVLPTPGSNMIVVKMDQFDNYIGFPASTTQLFLGGPEIIISNEDADGENYGGLTPQPESKWSEDMPLSLWIWSDENEFTVQPQAIAMTRYLTRDRSRVCQENGEPAGCDTNHSISILEEGILILTNEGKTFIDMNEHGINLSVNDANTSIIITKDGVKVEKDGTDLKTSMEELKAAIGALTVPTPSGPSGTPNNIVQINAAFDNIIEILN